MQLQLFEEIGGKKYSVRPGYGHDVCPYCGREKKITPDPRGAGFSTVAFRRHVFSCFEKALRKAGYEEETFDMEILRFPVVLI